MNILNINNYAYPRGGSEQYFFDLEKILQNEGHSVLPFGVRDKRNVYSNDDFPQGLDLKRPSLMNVSQFFYSRDARKKMIDIINHNNIDVAHLHIYHGQLTASILKPLKDAGIPIVQTLHDFKLVCSNSVLMSNNKFCQACRGGKHWKAILRRCNNSSYIRSAIYTLEAYVSEYLGTLNFVDQFITVSEYQKNILVSLGVPESKMTTIPHCIRVDDTAKTKADYFLYVGRLVKEKGIYDLIDAYGLLGEKNKPTLKIVGDGPEFYEIQKKLVGFKLKVELLGRKDGIELKELYRNAICLINPSYYNESFGLTVIESYAAGTPVIVANKGAMVGNVREGYTGYVFQCGDIYDLADKMHFFIAQPERSFLMGLMAYQLAEEKFNQDIHYQSILDVYRKAMFRQVQKGG